MASTLQLVGDVAKPERRPTTSTIYPNPRSRIEESTPVHNAAPDVPFIDVGGQSSSGKPRETHDDCFITADLTRSLVLGPSSLAFAEGTPWFGGAQSKLLAVAEGVEGSTAAPMASSVAVRALSRYVASLMPWVTDLDEEDERELEEELTRALVRSQKRLRAEARANGYDDATVATTMTIAYISWPQLFLLHVGDSVAYLYRDGRMQRLTRDGSIGARLAQRGVIPRDEAESPPYERAVANTLGGRSDQVDLELQRYRLSAGDQILLCTSALTRHLDEQEISRELDAAVTAQMACRRVVDAASRQNGDGRLTAVLARVEEEAASRPLPASNKNTEGARRTQKEVTGEQTTSAPRDSVVLHAIPRRKSAPAVLPARKVVEAAEPQWSVLGEPVERNSSEP